MFGLDFKKCSPGGQKDVGRRDSPYRNMEVRITRESRESGERSDLAGTEIVGYADGRDGAGELTRRTVNALKWALSCKCWKTELFDAQE